MGWRKFKPRDPRVGDRPFLRVAQVRKVSVYRPEDQHGNAAHSDEKIELVLTQDNSYDEVNYAWARQAMFGGSHVLVSLDEFEEYLRLKDQK